MGTPQQIGRLDTKNPGDSVDHIHTSRIAASFDRADVSSVNIGTVCQLFLRQATCLPKLSHIYRQDLSDVHA
jgi:hypothetical protein